MWTNYPQNWRGSAGGIADFEANLSKLDGKNIYVAIRSSATSEDLPDASFAGEQDTYLNIQEQYRQ